MTVTATAPLRGVTSDRRKTREEEAALMPGTAPRPRLRPPAGSRYGDSRDEREYAELRDQLAALEHDIAEARAKARHASALRPASRDAGAPPPRGGAVALPGGDRILVRPVEPGDAGLIRAGFDRLAQVSRYRRFLTPIGHLSPHQLDYLARVDHDHHDALGAVDPATGDGVGVARYVRDPADPAQAEVAVVVADAWQGRGVGSALAEQLAKRAGAAGVERVTARLLIGNVAARRLLERVAEPIDERRDDATVRITARLRAGAGTARGGPAAA